MTEKTIPAFEQLQTELFSLMHRYADAPDGMTALAVAVTIHRILRHALVELFPDFRRQLAHGLQGWKLRAHCSGCERGRFASGTGSIAVH